MSVTFSGTSLPLIPAITINLRIYVWMSMAGFVRRLIVFHLPQMAAALQRLRPVRHEKGLKFGIHIMRGIPRQAVSQNVEIKNSIYTAREKQRIRPLSVVGIQICTGWMPQSREHRTIMILFWNCIVLGCGFD